MNAAPAAGAGFPPGHVEHVSVAIRHRVRAGAESAYERWLARIMPVAAQWPGHLGVSVIRPGVRGAPYTVVVRFDRAAHLDAWLGSAERAALIDEVRPLLADGTDAPEAHSGPEFWFTPPGAPPPPRWKQVLMTLSVIYPLTLLVPALWAPAFARWPWLAGAATSNLMIALTIVVLVVCVIMPPYTRLLAGWLSR
ncbi:hypothetical protein EV699_10765 [Plasticicumulans lactativorans]|uniref:ABM domain-containing protein n=1 Tax=Plasticicumulans lactativorans TaxID=1133106 RepID=A0A4R2L586_9GAMM|nr:antibiotic biosynthesis monooxygenase [Plasticicumulans lactativorans]TCO81672.1 hypothetical protein EV699_10765 [Plasticicumulans lactativorans]